MVLLSNLILLSVIDLTLLISSVKVSLSVKEINKF